MLPLLNFQGPFMSFLQDNFKGFFRHLHELQGPLFTCEHKYGPNLKIPSPALAFEYSFPFPVLVLSIFGSVLSISHISVPAHQKHNIFGIYGRFLVFLVRLIRSNVCVK